MWFLYLLSRAFSTLILLVGWYEKYRYSISVSDVSEYLIAVSDYHVEACYLTKVDIAASVRCWVGESEQWRDGPGGKCRGLGQTAAEAVCYSFGSSEWDIAGDAWCDSWPAVCATSCPATQHWRQHFRTTPAAADNGTKEERFVELAAVG